MRSILRLLIPFLLALGFPTAAMAYIDPGSGMLLWQGLIAAVGAAIVFVRKPIALIKRLLARLRGK